ncbi:MAG TPA: DsbC family protein [Burkholderiales bacterium]|nr:DsbC family protein [Burkholderiales bacterium]
MTRTFLALLMLILAAPAVLADEAQIRRALEPKLGGARIDGVQPAPLPGLFEVRFRTAEGMQLIYVDASGSYVVQGKIYDIRTDRDLTGERLRKLNAIAFESLPLDQAVKIRRGNGSRVMAMFSDPYCPACRQFERELQKVDNLTLYVFMYPVIRPANKDHSKAVWCSPDRAKAWLELAANPQPKVPNASPNCANPVEKTLDLGRALGVSSTPTIYLANGERFTGMLPAGDLSDLLNQAMTQAKKP